MAKTAIEPTPTKARLLDAAESLMLAKGYAATTVDGICEAAKLTKGSFFHYFESKEQLGRELLERFCLKAFQRMRQEVAERESDPLKRVHGYVEFAVKLSREPEARRGCLLGTFAQELSDTNPSMRSQCAKAFTQWARLLTQDLDAAKARRAPKASFDTKSLAEHFIAILEGSMILAKAKADPKVQERSLRHFERYLEHLFRA